jgi:hypothetical protein
MHRNCQSLFFKCVIEESAPVISVYHRTHLDLPCIKIRSTWWEVCNKQPDTCLSCSCFSQFRECIYKPHLNQINLMMAINTYIIPLLRYPYGITWWSQTDLEILCWNIRTKMTKSRMCHKNCSLERLLLPKDKSGVGIMGMKNINGSQIKSLKNNFHNKINISHHIKIYESCFNLLNLLPNMILYHNKMKCHNTEKK